MSVCSVAVQLRYGVYVGHLSKLAFHFKFIVLCLLVTSPSGQLYAVTKGLRTAVRVAERTLRRDPAGIAAQLINMRNFKSHVQR